MTQAEIGIGIPTYNRYRSLETCISQILRLTRSRFNLVVADDGSKDETVALCAHHNIACVTGKNMGIAWNKNRALFFLNQMMECEVTIIIEDDCHPTNPGWERDWVAGAKKWGHTNFSGDWFRDKVLSGAGSIEDPFVSTSLSGQCTAFSRQALSICGYMDPRFKGYGYEHAEHSSRLVRAGFGGVMRMTGGGQLEPHYYLLASDLSVSSEESYRDEVSLAANWAAWTKMYRDPVYRYPWRTKEDFQQFRQEMTFAVKSANLPASRRLMLRAQWSKWRRRSRRLI